MLVDFKLKVLHESTHEEIGRGLRFIWYEIQAKRDILMVFKTGPTPLHFDLLSVYEAVSGLLFGNREPVQKVFTKN